MSDTRASGRSEWARGWGLVAACTAGMSLYGFAPMLLGLLMKPLQAAFGWKRAEISAMILIASVCALLVGPIVGWLVDRFGSRRVGLAGIVALNGSLAAMALAVPSVWSWYALSIVFGVLAQGANAITWTKAVSSRFDRSRGLALSVTLAGFSLCNLIAPSIAVRLLGAYGWRGAYIGLGVIGFVLAFSLGLFLLRDASDLAERGGQTRAAQRADKSAELPGFGVGEALTSLRFWMIALTIAFVAGSVGGFMIHMQPMLTDAGLTAAQAALAFSIIFGPFSILGRLSMGWALDRFYPPLIAGVAFALPALASVLLLQHGHGFIWTVLGALLAGVSLGAEIQIVSFLTGRYFGLRRYGAIYGFSYGFYSIGFGLGPVFAANAYDRFKSYDPFLIIAFVGLAISVVVITLLGKQPNFAAAPAPEPALELPFGQEVPEAV